MLYLLSETHDPYFNIATEEFILRNIPQDVFYLYRNGPSIIVGKNQNTQSEVNEDYIREHGIPVVRRQSGGGAVFHDLGNLNFCFITDRKSHGDTSFRAFTEPIVEVLRGLGLDADFTGRNDLTVDGRKISGNAQFHFRNRILHHGTLLFSSDITDLSAALKVKPYKLKKKGIKSVRSRVTNISEHLSQPLTIEQFTDSITQHMIASGRVDTRHHFSDTDMKAITDLVESKYGTWDWNYGQSPQYTRERVLSYSGGHIEYYLDIRRGTIRSLRLHGDFFGKQDPAAIEELLTGIAFRRADLMQALADVPIGEYFTGITLEEFVDGMVG